MLEQTTTEKHHLIDHEQGTGSMSKPFKLLVSGHKLEHVLPIHSLYDIKTGELMKLEVGAKYIITSWNSNTYIDYKGTGRFGVILQLGELLDEDKEYILIDPVY